MGDRGVVPYMFGVKYSTDNRNDTALYCSNKYGILFSIPRPCYPLCHPERSGTPGVEANDTTKQRRAVEPRPPGGAPAGGISVAGTHCVTHPANRGRGQRMVRSITCCVRLFRPHPAETGGYFCDLEMSRSNFSIARGRAVLVVLMRVEYTMDGSMMLPLRIICVPAKLFRKFRSTYR